VSQENTARHIRRLAAVGAALILGAVPNLAAASSTPRPRLAAGESCSAATAGDSFTAGQLAADNAVMGTFGARPTASPAHTQFIDWLEQQMDAVDGMQMSSVPYGIPRWDDQSIGLAAGPNDASLGALEPSGAVPLALATPAEGVTAPLLYVAAGTPLAGQPVAGKIVVRDAVPGTVPFAVFTAVEWGHYDPDLSLTTQAAQGASYERDFAGYQQRLDDLNAAGDGGAAGLIFVHGFPRQQVQGQYAPYEGVRWKVPALYVGADEGAQLKTLAGSAGSARITLQASDVGATTRMLVATLPGASPDRIVITSHTDGINPVWDNGPIAMLALARHFAALPIECRPRTLQFVFTTGHIFQRLLGTHDRGGSAELEAKELDQDYEHGSVAMVFALEHLGAKEYAAVPRIDGGPGRVLAPTGKSEVNTIFAGESPALVTEIFHAVAERNLARTYVLRGSDAPAPHVPIHNSFGGEGTAYQQHLIPTIAFVTGPWTLYNPAFGLEAIDFDLMRTQTLVFADMLHDLGGQPAAVLGGGYPAQRAARTQLCASALATMGFVRCDGDPYG
jgi:hypothetical protein